MHNAFNKNRFYTANTVLSGDVILDYVLLLVLLLASHYEGLVSSILMKIYGET